MAPASSSFAGAACFVLLLVLAGASVSHGSFLGRRVLSGVSGPLFFVTSPEFIQNKQIENSSSSFMIEIGRHAV
jgi:hypothetical protein